MSNLAKLSDLDTTFKKQSNKVNDLLKALEGKLDPRNLGVEVWAYDHPLSREPSSFYDQDNEMQCRKSEHLVLGWARYGAEYRLTVETVTYFWESGQWVMTNKSERTPLLQASRETCILALEKVDALVEVVNLKARKVDDSIQKAEQTIEKL